MEQKPAAPRFLRVSELGKELNLTRSVAYRFAQTLPHIKLNRTVLIDRVDLERALTQLKRGESK
jgi:DNA-binding IclR family transcriptional regulator